MLQKERQSGVERDAPLSRNFERTVSLVETTDSGQLTEQIKSMMDSTENYITKKVGQDLGHSFARFVEKKLELWI